MRRSTGVAVAVTLVTTVLVTGLALAAPNRTFTTSLTGAEEAPGPGDPNASGNATVTLSRPDQREICVSLSWANVGNTTDDRVTAAHIHVGPAGEPGPVVFTIFSNQNLPTTHSFPTMCGTATPRLITAIQNHPENYYVNVHSNEYPPGAVRGQLGD